MGAGGADLGVWGVPESDLGVLPSDVAGLDAVEMGCGTAYVSAGLARRGARPEWPDAESVEFHISHGDTVRLLRRSGFGVEDLVEVRPGEDANSPYDFVTLSWARRWPSEEVWKARRGAVP